MIERKFDAKLKNCCYGARLKRIRNNDDLKDKSKLPFHICAIGSFELYYGNYQKYRNDGLKTIRNQLESGSKVIAVSLDLDSYYHQIDVSALKSDCMHNTFDENLTPEEIEFTDEMSSFLKKWSTKASRFGKKWQVAGGSKRIKCISQFRQCSGSFFEIINSRRRMPSK